MNNKLDYGIESYKKKMKLDLETVGRVVRNEGYNYQIFTVEDGLVNASFNPNRLDRVYIGDFVEYMKVDDNCFITKVYPRKTVISKANNRTAKDFSHKNEEQILATNIDKAFILMASDQRFSISKLERYLLTFYQEEIEVNIIISKSDLSDKTERIILEIEKYYPDLSIYTTSIFDEESIEKIKHLVGEHATIVLLGSSGAGKSTLINALNHVESELVGETRRDGKGKHTTTYSSLIPLMGTQSYLVDTPGFKGIDTANEVDGSVLFSDILSLSKQCKFSDCQHDTEQGCAVKNAIEVGELTQEKYERFLVNNKKMIGLQRYEMRKQRQKESKIRKNMR